MSLCHPEVDWSCIFTAGELETMRADAADAEKLLTAEAFGWSLLASLTANQIAICPVAVRPCAKRCQPDMSTASLINGGITDALGFGSGSFNPHITGGSWVNACGCRTGDCSCTKLSEIILPGPVGGIESIMQDGAVVPATSYRVDNGNRLVRLDGEEWPVCQDMTLPGDAVGALVVRYWRGAPPNRMTRQAAGMLAADFYRACAGDNCSLPNSVVSASLQGTSYEFEAADFPDGVTGIKAVDAVIRIYNPYKRRMQTKIVSPDSRSPRVPTWVR